MYMCTCVFKYLFLHEPILNSNSNFYSVSSQLIELVAEDLSPEVEISTKVRTACDEIDAKEAKKQQSSA